MGGRQSRGAGAAVGLLVTLWGLLLLLCHLPVLRATAAGHLPSGRDASPPACGKMFWAQQLTNGSDSLPGSFRAGFCSA